MERADIVSEGFFSGLQFELYDLASDPKETTNLAEEQEVSFCCCCGIMWMSLTGGKMSKMQESAVGRMLALLEEEVARALALPKVQDHKQCRQIF